jgi:uncharacterized protein YjbJ (UPF0337 family)
VSDVIARKLNGAQCLVNDPILGSSTNVKGNLMNKDQVKGTVKDAIGKVQEKAGEVTGSAQQEAKGLIKQAEGKLQKATGDVKEALKNSGHK